jgi:predicted amidohydrolase
MESASVTVAVVQATPVEFNATRTIENLPEKREDLRRCFGTAIIMAPLGNILVELDLDGELIQVAELDRDDIASGEYDFDVVAHYASPDVFRSHANEQAQSTTALSSKGEPNV